MSFFSEEQINLLSNRTVKVDLVAKLEFKTETFYVWNGEYKININGNVYFPLHGTAQIEGLSQANSTESQAITISLNGLNNDNVDFLSIALKDTSEVDQQFINIYMQLFDEDWQPIGAPIGIWWGFMQPLTVSRSETNAEQGATQMITLNAENAFFNRSRPSSSRYTDRDQQKRYPNDKFFQFTSSLINKTITYPDY